MLFRSWLTFTIVIGVVQVVLGLLAILQHDAIYANLLRQRIGVIAQTIVASYKPIVDLGLPVSMIRNGDEIVLRAKEMDGEIKAAHTFNPSGIIVHSTENPHPQSVSVEVLRQMRLSDRNTWGVETPTELVSGRTIKMNGEDTVGAVSVSYPKDRLTAASRALLKNVAWAALLIWAAFSAIAYVVLRLILARPRSALKRLDIFSRSLRGDQPVDETVVPADEGGDRGVFGAEIARLERNLVEASRRHDASMRALGAEGEPDTAGAHGIGGSRGHRDARKVAADPSRSLARALALRLAPPAAVVIAVSAIFLGIVVLWNVNRSIEPELAARANLIGVVVSENVRRAVDAGAPLDKLVGAENYFGDMLIQLPEIAYVAVATGRIVLEAGKRIDPYLAPPRQRKGVRSHPIMHNGEEIAYVIIDIDPAFITKRFRDVFLDMSVVVLVTILIAYEIMVLMTSRSLTAQLDRLQRLAAMQAAGDFSSTAPSRSRGTIADLTRKLSERAETLHAAFSRALSEARAPGARSSIEASRNRLGLGGEPPAPIQVSYFTDIRLALFLFAAADELPLSFMPLYTRAADNLWPWLDRSVLISLPLAGYLIAIVFASPFARALNHRFGVRALFLAAGLPMVVAHLGLYFATTAQEIILWRSVTGIGYALITLACQDYVLDTASADQRDKTLGVFTLVLFGGIFSGVALGGVLADRLGQENVFLVSATLIATSAALSARLIARDAAKGMAEGAHFRLAAIAAPLRNLRFAAVSLGISIPAGVLMQAFASYLVALTLDSFGASTADIGRALMLFFIGVMVAGPIGGRLAEAGVAVWQVAVAGAALAGAALLGFSVWPVEAMLIVALPLCGVGFGVVRGAQTSLAMTIAETELAHIGTVTVLGSLRTLERIGSVVGLVLIAGVSGAFGYTVAIGVTAIWVLAGSLLFLLAFFRSPGLMSVPR